MTKRKAIPTDVRQLVLHEAGYKCANPACRHVITLDVHHMEYVSEEGSNDPSNLLPLCPNCHALHHAGHIPTISIRAWKMLLLALNEALDRNAVDILLLLDKLGEVKRLSGEGVLAFASLVAGDMVVVHEYTETSGRFSGVTNMCRASLSDKGKLFVEAWKSGDQAKAIAALGGTATA